jgi:CHASE3 domain sensor protein
MVRQLNYRLSPIRNSINFKWKLTSVLMCISCFAVVTIYIFKYLIDPSDRSSMVERTNNVIIVSDQLVSTLKDTRTNARNYLITDNESFFKSFTKDVSLIDQHLALLKN